MKAIKVKSSVRDSELRAKLFGATVRCETQVGQSAASVKHNFNSVA